MRERGSKLALVGNRAAAGGVAPRAGAWIETGNRPALNALHGQVAPRAGAWIETLATVGKRCSSECRSPCGSVDRNSQPRSSMTISRGRSPCGSVDRNDPQQAANGAAQLSLPVRERGSKHEQDRSAIPALRRSPCGSVDRNTIFEYKGLRVPCRSPCGSVDRNKEVADAIGLTGKSLPVRERGSKLSVNVTRLPSAKGRSPCGSVDRNDTTQIYDCDIFVAPRAGAWIETVLLGLDWSAALVAPRAGAWIETLHGLRGSFMRERRSPCGSVDRNNEQTVHAMPSNWSLPVRERGSKRRHNARFSRCRVVAPRAGAWIETPPRTPPPCKR